MHTGQQCGLACCITKAGNGFDFGFGALGVAFGLGFEDAGGSGLYGVPIVFPGRLGVVYGLSGALNSIITPFYLARGRIELPPQE